MPVSARALGRSILAALLLTALGATGARAQTIRGTVVNLNGGTPLPRASLVLLDSAGLVVDSTRASTTGVFTLHAPGPGTYVVYFSHPGYASVPSDPIPLAAGQTVRRRIAVPLIGGAALERMSEVIDVEKRLQTDIVALCGERPRSEEAGILVGVVRRRPGDHPLARAVVRVEAPAPPGGEPFRKATVSSANGVYVVCNVPVGHATMRTDLTGYRTDVGPVEVRAGSVGWYDVYLRPLAGRPH